MCWVSQTEIGLHIDSSSLVTTGFLALARCVAQCTPLVPTYGCKGSLQAEKTRELRHDAIPHKRNEFFDRDQTLISLRKEEITSKVGRQESYIIDA